MQFEELLRLIDKVSESELTELKYEESGLKVRLVKQKEQVQVITAEAEPASSGQEQVLEEPAQASVSEPGDQYIVSPLVGTFYSAPAEDADSYVSVGDTVKKGQTLAIIEAMKLMNEIESEYDGIIAEILVENGQAVEYGQPLFRISESA